MSQWINSETDKPRHGKEVLGACFDDGLLLHNIVVWDAREEAWFLVGLETVEMDVKFWMELPALPKMQPNASRSAAKENDHE